MFIETYGQPRTLAGACLPLLDGQQSLIVYKTCAMAIDTSRPNRNPGRRPPPDLGVQIKMVSEGQQSPHNGRAMLGGSF